MKTIKINPVPKPRMTRRDKWKKRPCVVKYRNFCDELRFKVGNYKLPAEVKMKLYIPVFKSYSNKKKERLIGSPHQQRPDIDNFVKAIFDALTEEDDYIYHVDAAKYWAKEGEGRIIFYD